MFMEQSIEMNNMLLGKAPQAQVETSKDPLDFGPFVAKGSITRVIISPQYNLTIKGDIFNALDLKSARGRGSMVIKQQGSVNGPAPNDFKSMLDFANGFDKNVVSSSIGAEQPYGMAAVFSDVSTQLIRYSLSDLNLIHTFK